MLWFTADTHFGHSNIIASTQRPFQTVEEMDEALVAGINARVAPTDQLYVLGDFSYRIPVEEACRIRRLIWCRNVHLVRGNHDKHWSDTPCADAFASEQDYLELKDAAPDGRRLVLFHYPIASWNDMGRGAIHLHGHIHSLGPSYNEANRAAGVLRFDVGVDANGYRPVSLDEILSFFEGVEPKAAPFSWDGSQAMVETDKNCAGKAGSTRDRKTS